MLWYSLCWPKKGQKMGSIGRDHSKFGLYRQVIAGPMRCNVKSLSNLNPFMRNA